MRNDLGLTTVIIDSIRANAVSLLAQLQEYEFLTVSKEQKEKLNIIEIQLHDLVNEIVNPLH